MTVFIHLESVPLILLDGPLSVVAPVLSMTTAVHSYTGCLMPMQAVLLGVVDYKFEIIFFTKSIFKQFTKVFCCRINPQYGMHSWWLQLVAAISALGCALSG